MVAAEMRTFFDLLQDKSGSPWFTPAEKDLFLEDVIWGYINGFIGDGDTPPSLEKNKGSVAAIQTLIKRSSAISIPSTGILTNALIEAQLSSRNIVIPLAFNLSTGESAHFVRHNDIGTFEGNTYQAGISLAPNYTMYDASYQFYPKEAYTGLIATVIVKPIGVADLPDYKHWEQVSKAMEKTGFVTEAEALVIMGKES